MISNKKKPNGVYARCVGMRIMLNGIGKLSSVSTTNVCRRDGDVLLDTLEDDLHTRVPLLLKTKRTSILPTIFLNKCTSTFNNSM